MNEFKHGDRVRIIDSGVAHMGYYLNKEGVVITTGRKYTYGNYVLVTVEGEDVWFFMKWLELLPTHLEDNVDSTGITVSYRVGHFTFDTLEEAKRHRNIESLYNTLVDSSRNIKQAHIIEWAITNRETLIKYFNTVEEDVNG